MKHAKRMVLVPEEMLSRYEQKQRLETSPITANMMQKDAQLSNILQQTDMYDDQKEKLFHANLERYLNLKQQKDSEIPTVQLAQTTEEKTAIQELPDSVIVETVPKRMRERATAILNRLKTRPDVITWDRSGEVKLEGRNIPQSNISDLISDAVRGRKNFTPTGSKEFFHVLSKINVPRDLVRNEERWRQTHILSDDDDGDTAGPSGTQMILGQAKKPKITLSPKWQAY